MTQDKSSSVTSLKDLSTEWASPLNRSQINKNMINSLNPENLERPYKAEYLIKYLLGLYWDVIILFHLTLSSKANYFTATKYYSNKICHLQQ